MSYQERSTETDPALLEALVCPVTREELVYARDKHQLSGKKGRRTYAIQSGIPIMLPERT